MAKIDNLDEYLSDFFIDFSMGKDFLGPDEAQAKVERLQTKVCEQQRELDNAIRWYRHTQPKRVRGARFKLESLQEQLDNAREQLRWAKAWEEHVNPYFDKISEVLGKMVELHKAGADEFEIEPLAYEYLDLQERQRKAAYIDKPFWAKLSR